MASNIVLSQVEYNVEAANPGHPYGAHGVGEVPIVPPPAAIASAVAHAIRVRMQKLPVNPGAILEAMWDKAK